jgi:hypothetical protein
MRPGVGSDPGGDGVGPTDWRWEPLACLAELKALVD